MATNATLHGHDHFDKMPLSFFELHNDAVLAILDHLPDPELVRFASTCRRVSELARPILEDRHMKHKWTVLDFLNSNFHHQPSKELLKLMRDPIITKYAQEMVFECPLDGYCPLNVPDPVQDIGQYEGRIAEEISKLGISSEQANVAWAGAVIRGEFTPTLGLILAMCQNLDALLMLDPWTEHIEMLGRLLTITPKQSVPYINESHQRRSVLSISDLGFTRESSKETRKPLLQTLVSSILLAPSLRKLRIDWDLTDPSSRHLREAEAFRWPEGNKLTCNIQHLYLRGLLIKPSAIFKLIERMLHLQDLEYDQHKHRFVWYTRLRHARLHPGSNILSPEFEQEDADGHAYISTYPDELLKTTRTILEERGLYLRKRVLAKKRVHSEAFHIYIAQTKKSDGKLPCEKWPTGWVYVGP